LEAAHATVLEPLRWNGSRGVSPSSSRS
jgi:hypothetical protein